ncbi:hypothetical protein EJ03DRAFT_322701 [Teratosphaeria nubilosa]|uniref:Uncharacterized protein n=1 Tax=Teratosphaeria nubilosa TaxID=161662 RepID=A0A6G1LMD3_9PEZI|nr:hypothetical protein EJ03DRAFT_322701 [Teratosphaeria nubilosa]
MPRTAYFPSLDRCLAGPERLVSWKDAYLALSDVESAKTNSELEHFFQDEETTNALLDGTYFSSPPTHASKGVFETKVAPINVAQSSNGGYNLDEIKKDTLWLSHELQIEEVVALRIAIVEWQERSADQLLLTAGATGADAGAIDFTKEEVRHDRLLKVYLEERQSLLRIRTELVSFEAITAVPCPWLGDLTHRVAQRNQQDSISFSVAQVERSLQDAISQSSWPQVFKDREEVYGLVMMDKLADRLRTLLALVHAQQREAFVDPDSVLRWFRLMDSYGFLQDLQGLGVLVETIQCLVAVISLAILEPPKVLQSIQQLVSPAGNVQYSTETNKSYFAIDDTVKHINEIMQRAAKSDHALAGPAMYAWAIIALLVQGKARIEEARRERALDDAVSSDTDTGSGQMDHRRASRLQESEIERKSHLFYLQESGGEEPGVTFFRAAIEGLQTYSMIRQLSDIVTTVCGSDLKYPTAVMARLTLLDLVRIGLDTTSYTDEVVEAVLAILDPGTDQQRIAGRFVRLAQEFVDDTDYLRAHILDQALARYPYELSPVLRLCTVLSNSTSSNAAGPTDIFDLLERLSTITLVMPMYFDAYVLEHEEKGNNSCQLTSPFRIFVPKQDSFHGQTKLIADQEWAASERQGSNNVLVVQEGTSGTIVREDRPRVLQLQHNHSAVEYLGLLLSTFLPSSALKPANMESLNHLTASEIIGLITALVRAAGKQHQGVQEAKFVLERVSNALPESLDITLVVGRIFEIELLAHSEQAAQPGSLELAIACAEYFEALTDVTPERVWSTLHRSSLLGLNTGGACALAAVVAGVEVHISQYRFLAACTRLYYKLVADSISGLIKRKAKEPRRGNRFDSPMEGLDLTPERSMENVLSAFTRIMLEVQQNLGTWKFDLPEEKQVIASLTANAFDKLLRLAFGLEASKPTKNADGTEKKARKKISALLTSSAAMVLDAFAPVTTAGPEMVVKAVSGNLADGLAVSDSLLPLQVRTALINQIKQTATTLRTALRTARTSEEPKRAFNLASEMAKQVPVVASLYAAEHSWRGQLVDLLSKIVNGLASTDADPYSLLGGLHHEASKSFLAVISELDRPVCDVNIEIKIWDFLSTVLKHKQKAFGIYLLTGTEARMRFDGTATNNLRHQNGRRTLLSYALDQLSNVNKINPKVAVCMLRFAAAAQEVWIPATKTILDHPDFINSLLSWLETLKVPGRGATDTDSLMSAREHLMAAYICDILSLALHRGMEIGDRTLLQKIAPKLSFLSSEAARVDSYNRSLHKQLAENMSAMFPGVEISDFKRSQANTAPYGASFVYDHHIAETILGYREMAWYGNIDERTNTRSGLVLVGQNGFESEVKRANANLSLVDAQTRLLGSWKALATTLAGCITDDERVPRTLVRAVQAALTANTEAAKDVPGMAELLKIRAELAFVLLSKLIGMRSSVEGTRLILPTAWALVRKAPVDFDVAVNQDDLGYYRLLLEVLFLALRPHVYLDLPPFSQQKVQAPALGQSASSAAMDPAQPPKPILDPQIAAILVEIAQQTIASSFRALCSNLHQDLTLALPADFALITALLQTILAVKGAETAAYAQIARVVSNSNLIRHALSLYSWSDCLAELTDQDPVYGEIAVTFLVRLSSVPAIAESLALEGVLLQLSNANLSTYFRKPGGKGPFDQPVRVFSIWTEGFLPLCINILDSVGPIIAGKVSGFLNNFPEQLARAESAFQVSSNKRGPFEGAVTLGLVKEARKLITLGKIIESCIAFAAADGVDASEIAPLSYDLTVAKAEVEKLVRGKRALGERLVPGSEREVKWAREGRLVRIVERELAEAVEVGGGEG